MICYQWLVDQLALSISCGCPSPPHRHTLYLSSTISARNILFFTALPPNESFDSAFLTLLRISMKLRCRLSVKAEDYSEGQSMLILLGGSKETTVMCLGAVRGVCERRMAAVDWQGPIYWIINNYDVFGGCGHFYPFPIILHQMQQGELDRQTSITSIAISSEEERPKPNKHTLKRLESLVIPGDFQPFKLLYKCIHPESTLHNSSQVGSEPPSIKLPSCIDNNTVESSMLEMNAVRSVVLSRMGLRNFDDMENQDVVLEDQISNKAKIYAIFDGHGEYGKLIAEAAKAIFKKLLQKYSQEIKNENSILSIESIVRKVLEKTNSYILHYHVEEAQFSGTTALILLITRTKLYVFNVGNSRLVIGKHYTKGDRVEPFQVTHDHTIARFDERARILKSGGVISPYKNEKGEQVGPERIWAKNEAYPGMFLTRTLGLSCAYKIGVISQPEVNVIEYKPCYRYLILASDGFWSVEENDEVVKYFQKGKKGEMQKMVGALMGEAVRRWTNKNVLMDDITLIFVALN